MCLMTIQSKPEIADKDIICYKMVTKSKIKGAYWAEYQSFEYIIRRLYTNDIDISCIGALLQTEHYKYAPVDIHYISNFMFHSYLVPYKYSIRADTIVKCVIPKGAYYFEGKHNGRWGYASSQIKILEEICFQ